ncbi:MAG: class I SAM-dependent methyltransferase [Gemmatimonadota bacterium]
MRLNAQQRVPRDVERARLREGFDEAASAYEVNRLAPWYQEQGRMVLEELGVLSGPLVDVGCGTGWFLRRVAESHPGTACVGVDLSAGMVARAREAAESEGLAGVCFLEGDWENEETLGRVAAALPTPAAAVTCISAFHYFRDPVAALAGMRRILAPGGRVILVERALDGSPLTTLWDLLHRRVLRDGVRFYRTREIELLMIEAGVDTPRTVRRVRRYFWKGKLYTSLGVVTGTRARAPADGTAGERGEPGTLHATPTNRRDVHGC